MKSGVSFFMKGGVGVSPTSKLHYFCYFACRCELEPELYDICRAELRSSAFSVQEEAVFLARAEQLSRSVAYMARLFIPHHELAPILDLALQIWRELHNC
jgi:hypothetical protein